MCAENMSPQTMRRLRTDCRPSSCELARKNGHRKPQRIKLSVSEQDLCIERLLDALPYRPPMTPAKLHQIEFVTWRGKPSPIYNGFTSDERLHLWQLARWLLAQGIMTPAKQCDICGSREKVQLHSENYYNPFRAAAVCGACHRLIHLRFWRWAQWQELCRANDPAEKAWYSLLRLEQPDIASYMRDKHGPHVSGLMNSPLYQLPEGCAEMLSGMNFPP